MGIEQTLTEVHAMVSTLMERLDTTDSKLDFLKKFIDSVYGEETMSRIATAKALGVSVGTIDNYTDKKILNPIKRGRNIHFLKKEVIEFKLRGIVSEKSEKPKTNYLSLPKIKGKSTKSKFKHG